MGLFSSIFNFKESELSPGGKALQEAYALGDQREQRQKQREHDAMPVDPVWEKILQSLQHDEWEYKDPPKSVRYRGNTVVRKKDGIELYIDIRHSYGVYGQPENQKDWYTMTLTIEGIESYANQKEGERYYVVCKNIIDKNRDENFKKQQLERQQKFDELKTKYGLG